jgi:cell division protein FtsI/penicillin-binding protein 2
MREDEGVKRHIAAVAVLSLAATGCGLFGGGDDHKADNAAKAFLDAWAAGNVAQAAQDTDDPTTAQATLQKVKETLAPTAATFAVGTVSKNGGSGTAAFHATLTVPGLPTPWEYDGSLALTKKGDNWQVHWQPSDLHPKLADGQSLAVKRTLPGRASLLDASGKPIFSQTAVVTVGINPSLVKDLRSLATTLSTTLATRLHQQVSVEEITTAVGKAKPNQFVPVITLRDADYQKVRAIIRPLPGTVFQTGERLLAPTATFGQPLLGRVGAATADVLKELGPAYAATDQVGTSGLQRALNKELTGTPSTQVVIVDTGGNPVGGALASTVGKPGTAVRTTLDVTVQSAAEAALATVPNAGAIVAIRPSTGEILAAVNSAAAPLNMALVGQYPAGSTFKIITATALLDTKVVNPAQPQNCPGTTTIGGRVIHNEDSFDLGAVNLETAFAHSCNTTFAGDAPKLPDGALVDTAAKYGIGAGWQLAAPTFSGSLPAPADDVELSADAIGQGKVLVSPFAMAVVVAGLQHGSIVPPSIIAGQPATVKNKPAALPAGPLATVRTYARAVVTEGTATGLADLPGNVSGKTGTAEYGTAVPPRSHAWFVGYQGDLAFAVFIQDGESSHTTAVPVAHAFLSALK